MSPRSACAVAHLGRQEHRTRLGATEIAEYVQGVKEAGRQPDGPAAELNREIKRLRKVIASRLTTAQQRELAKKALDYVLSFRTPEQHG
jgi:hypothetical protein